MDLGARDTLLTVATTAALLAGIGLVLFGDAAVATLGIVLVVVSAVVFVVDAKDLIVKTDENARD